MTRSRSKKPPKDRRGSCSILTSDDRPAAGEAARTRTAASLAAKQPVDLKEPDSAACFLSCYRRGPTARSDAIRVFGMGVACRRASI